MTELVHYDLADEVATLTLDSPANRNALSAQLVSELDAGLARAEGDSGAKIVLLRSSDRVFCSGADLSEAHAGGMETGAKAVVALQRRILALDKPVVARLDGPVRAGGIGIVAAADLAIASTQATFALTEVRLGLTPAVISLTVLPRLTSRAAARTFLTGETFDGDAAQEMGLVTEAVEDVDAAMDKALADLRKGTFQGLRESKRLVNASILAGFDKGDELAALSAGLFASDEAREAMAAFLSKR